MIGLPGAVVGQAWPAGASLPPSTVHCSPRGFEEPPTALAAIPPCLQREPDWRRPAIPQRWLPDGDWHKQAQQSHSLTSGEHLGGATIISDTFLTKTKSGFRKISSVHTGLTCGSVFNGVLLRTRIDRFDQN